MSQTPTCERLCQLFCGSMTTHRYVELLLASDIRAGGHDVVRFYNSF